MKLTQSQIVRICILTVAVSAIFMSSSLRWRPTRPIASKARHTSPIPPEGVADSIDTKGEIPGNPERTRLQMQQLAGAIAVYNKRHSGSYPRSSDFVKDLIAASIDYGFGDPASALRAFRNPDMQYADRAARASQPETYFPYNLLAARHDGSLIGTEKMSGTKDVIAWTDMYYHRNIIHLPGDNSKTNPVGFYMVLWDDGTITKVDFQDVRFLKDRSRYEFPECFPGQSGISLEETLSYEQYQLDVKPIAIR